MKQKVVMATAKQRKLRSNYKLCLKSNSISSIICTFAPQSNTNDMAIVGYIMSFKHLEQELKADIQWMQEHGCCTIYIEDERNEKSRIEWKDMLEQLACGDEIVISKFSHAVRGCRELSVFCDYLRREKVTVISIHDEMDTSGKLFAQKTLPDFMDMLATLPTEAMALRQAHEHEAKLRARKHPRTVSLSKSDRNNKIVRMYKQGESIEKIWKLSGFKSRQSVFNVLTADGVNLNRGHSKKELDDKRTKQSLTAPQE